MERKSRLAENLRAYQQERGKTLSEFAAELGVARSTLQSVMLDGNTTADTLIRIANGLDVTLDELVFGDGPLPDRAQDPLAKMAYYVRMPLSRRDLFRDYLNKLLDLLDMDGPEPDP